MHRSHCYPLPLAALCLAALCVLISGVSADPRPAATPLDNPYVRIEEDWKLVVNDADYDRAAPQVAVQMAPSPTSDYFGVFQLNHRELSSYTTGGMQVQIWEGGTNKAYKSYGSAIMANSSETVTWTQFMAKNVESFRIKFGIQAGSSSTWGDLSTAGLSVRAREYTEAADISLENYDPSYSVNNSGITYGANRVQVLQLLQVRKYRADGTVETDSTVRTVHQAGSSD